MRNKTVSVVVLSVCFVTVFCGAAMAQTTVYVPQAPSGLNPANPYETSPTGTVLSTRYNSALDRPQRSSNSAAAAVRVADRMMDKAIEYREKGDIETACAVAQQAALIVQRGTPTGSSIADAYQREADKICRAGGKA